MCPADAPLSSWLALLRRLCPQLAQKTPAEMLTESRSTGRIDLGIVEGRHAQRIDDTLRPHGFEVQVEDASSTTHFPQVHKDGLILGLTIEDEAENEAFCSQLIQDGARVVSVEA